MPNFLSEMRKAIDRLYFIVSFSQKMKKKIEKKLWNYKRLGLEPRTIESIQE